MGYSGRTLGQRVLKSGRCGLAVRMSSVRFTVRVRDH